MPKIKQLSSHEAQKIAAGEVVERPANIVKELIENSIDAGANSISIYIKDAGKKCIRIMDNGCGMEMEDARLCFDRHATSKITHVDDLETITSFGFRGEALASIVAVSRVILTTKEEGNSEGICIINSAGTIEVIKNIACSTGTDITVENLFFNVPARKKFLKSSETEWRAIQLLFNAFCFDYPHIRFSLFNNNKLVHNHPAVNLLHKRALQVWEASLHNHVLVIQKNDAPHLIVEGIISDHQSYRYDKSAIYFFVNKRWIKNYQLNNALIKGYTNVIPEGRYPLAAIHITIPASEVDINIHPRKEEVKFLHPRKIEQALQQLVKAALEENLSRQIKKEVTFQSASQHAPPSLKLRRTGQEERLNNMASSHFTPFNFDTFFLSNSAPSSLVLPVQHSLGDVGSAADLSSKALAKEGVSVSKNESEINNTLSYTDQHNFNLIGQYNKTYLLIEKEDGLFLVDQHAAHERILYELFAKKFQQTETVALLFPQIIHLSSNEIDILIPHFGIFQEHGILLEQCATNQLMIQSLPVYLKNISFEPLIKEMVNWIIENKIIDAGEFKKSIHHALQAQMACKAAVKAGDELTQEKMKQLLTDLNKTANRFSCPHGRPTGWLISLNEIEKKFRRKL